MRTLKIALLAATALLLSSTQAQAFSDDNHTGTYLYAMGGFMTLNNDTNAQSGLKFGNNIEPAFGLTVGYNITDWIAPEIQIAYSTSTGTTASGSAREHAVTIRLNGKYSFLTNLEFNQQGWKFFPYVKLGGVGHGLFVNAPAPVDKIGAYGGGVGIGAGLEINWKYLYLGLDVSNDLLWLGKQTETVSGVSVVIINGGFDYQISVMGAVGTHF